MTLKKKVLLMGKSGSGKTSMRSIIFANYIARDTRRLGATIDVEHSHVKLLGSLTLHLWDCGGQDQFMQNYIGARRDNIFTDVAVLIYVFDVESRELEKDREYYRKCLEAITQSSPKAKIVCLIHKIDLIEEDRRDVIFQERCKEIKELSKHMECHYYKSSIWDETLYKAWSSIAHLLIPNIEEIENFLEEFADIYNAEEILLFERATFLMIAKTKEKKSNTTINQSKFGDKQRFEKFSNIIKRFKMSCGRVAAQFSSMEVRNKNFSAFLEMFSPFTVICVIMPKCSFSSKLMSMGIASARKNFKKIGK